MNEKDRQENAAEASEFARRARRQGRSSARNAGRAAKVAAEPVIDSVAEEVHDAANKIEGAAEETVNRVREVDPKVLSRISGDTAQGFIAVGVSIWAASIASSKFRSAIAVARSRK